MKNNRVRSQHFSSSLVPRSKICTSLHLESLESRMVLSVSANEVYVSSLFQGLLGRDPGATDLAAWAGMLNGTLSLSQVALAIERSDEFSSRAVQTFYQDFLKRPADSDGLNSWVEAIRQGSTVEDVKAIILGSDEFYADSGGTMDSFLNAVYSAELGRSIDPAGLAYWTSVTMNDPVSRAMIAAQIMRSSEGAQLEIRDIYELTLGRAPDPSGLAAWTAALQQGDGDLKITAAILGSNEYFDVIQQFASAGDDPNVAAHEFIVSADRFNATLPGAEQLDAAVVTNPSLLRPPFHQRPIPFIPLCGSSGPYVTTGPGVPFGPGGGSSGGFTGGGSSGGGSSGGSGGGSGSLRAAAPHDGQASGDLSGVGGRGQGSGLYMGGGLLNLGQPTTSGPLTQAGAGAPNGSVLPYPANFTSSLSGELQQASIAPSGSTDQVFNGSMNTPVVTDQLTDQQLQSTVMEALSLLEQAGIRPALLARLESVTYEVGWLSQPLLGYTFARAHTVVIDPNAAGYGWFVDPTPLSNAEFARTATGAIAAMPGEPASGHMDLETVVLHEMGHVAGFGDVDSQTHPNYLMDLTLPPGVRRIDALDAIFGGRSG